MNIQEEYQKLTELSQTKEGWKTIEKAWSVATSKQQEEIPWYENPLKFVTESRGDKVEGFAIDSKTKKAFTGTYTHHTYACERLYDYLLTN